MHRSEACRHCSDSKGPVPYVAANPISAGARPRNAAESSAQHSGKLVWRCLISGLHVAPSCALHLIAANILPWMGDMLLYSLKYCIAVWRGALPKRFVNPAKQAFSCAAKTGFWYSLNFITGSTSSLSCFASRQVREVREVFEAGALPQTPTAPLRTLRSLREINHNHAPTPNSAARTFASCNNTTESTL